MDTNHLYHELQELENQLLTMGYVRPEAQVWVNWSSYSPFFGKIEYSNPRSGESKRERFNSSQSAVQTLEAMRDFINNLKTPEDERKKDFLQSLTNLIAEGKDLDLDPEFINPLTSMMEQLSTNILEGPRTPYPYHDDEIPF